MERIPTERPELQHKPTEQEPVYTSHTLGIDGRSLGMCDTERTDGARKLGCGRMRNCPDNTTRGRQGPFAERHNGWTVSLVPSDALPKEKLVTEQE